MITKSIEELAEYGVKAGLLAESDRIYVINQLLALFSVEEYEGESQVAAVRPLHEILVDLTEYAAAHGMLEEDTVTCRDLFDTKVMGLLTPRPSEVIREFYRCYESAPEKATEYFYQFSRATNYIREDRIRKDEKWTVDSDYGVIDITINLSKPEKDPREIAKARKAKQSSYPKCLLCKENVGFEGDSKRPARQNHRIIPLELAGEQWSMQYSPYVYYNEHCIVLNNEHIPMKIDRGCFMRLLDFIKQFPHYFLGSNADLPIVGGSILTHDHYQGGCYEFAMAKAPAEYEFQVKGYEDIEACIVKWPLSVIRIKGKDEKRLVALADHILTKWRGYTDEEAFIYASTDGVSHNTITPIARFRDGQFELDLVLRNNITTKESPYGVYHPREEYHHIKKENIGLIEVMGLAVLPSRLKRELELLSKVILSKESWEDHPEIQKHKQWVESWKDRYALTEETVYPVLQQEVGKVFVKVLEDAGVYKCNEQGREAFGRFLDYVGQRQAQLIV